jgi:acyl-coenzyme A synthetase/AMP-(fatty) acid ligase
LGEYVMHYNQHRPHRARNLRPPDHDDNATAPAIDLTARIRRRNVLGGLINEYERAADEPTPSAEEIIALTREKVGSVHKVTAAEFVDALPKSGIGKVSRREVRERERP